MWKTKRQIYKENVIKIKFYEETVNFILPMKTLQLGTFLPSTSLTKLASF